jgi:hypothetical protein
MLLAWALVGSGYVPGGLFKLPFFGAVFWGPECSFFFASGGGDLQLLCQIRPNKVLESISPVI